MSAAASQQSGLLLETEAAFMVPIGVHFACLFIQRRLGSFGSVVQFLQKAGLPDAQLVHLRSQVFHLQCAFERMAVVKEYR